MGEVRNERVSTEIRGSVDFCDQHAIGGWTNAPSLEVYVNGETRGEAIIEAIRDEVVADGIGGARNFTFTFHPPLWLTDRVTLRLSNNRLLAPDQGNSHLDRLMLLVSPLDFTRPGLEFGPLDRPTVPRAHANVYYVDHKNREGLRQKYAHIPDVNLSQIASIDYVWTNECPLSQVVQEQKFGWVLASQVAEHISDFIGWLRQVEDVLEDRGCVSLALPHGERTFDSRRTVSTFEDLVAAHIMKLDRPSAHQVLRHMLGVSEWSGTDLRMPEHGAGLCNAVAIARHANAGDYVDVHCNVFTPKSFAACYALIRRCGLVGLELGSVIETNAVEFFVHFEKKK